MNFGERFLEAFNNASIADIARKTDKTYQGIKNYAAGRIPEWKVMLEISNSTGCSIHWLLTGEGEKFVGKAGTSVPKRLAPALLVEDTAPAPELIPDIGIPTAAHRLQPVPLRGTITGQKIVPEDLRVLVPSILVESNSVLFKIEGDDLATEGLHDGDVLIACPAVGDVEGKIVIALLSGKIIVRHYSTTKERHPRGVSDDPRHPAVKPCERLSERAEWRRARAALCLPPAPLPRFALRRMAMVLIAHNLRSTICTCRFQADRLLLADTRTPNSAGQMSRRYSR